ncbi:MAG: transposase [bacterium LCO1.1]|uniref:Transposase n=1 Tax=Candidatus Weimeria bifida TaxID=2599074 RepID=A0A6N7J007_9FIRM|nr:transposase [Candidatus Weimeria bifida]
MKTFLDHPEVPLDNNDAERSIRKFCVESTTGTS